MADDTAAPDIGPDTTPHDDFDVPATSDLHAGPSAGTTSDSSPGSPATARSAADPASGTGQPGIASQEPGTAPQQPGSTPQAPTTPPIPSALPAHLAQRLRASGLREIPGEDQVAAETRLYDHLHKRGQAFYHEAREQRQQLANIQAQQATLLESLRPILEAHYAQARAAQTEQLAAEIPEKGTPEYTEWLLEQQIIREQEKEELAAQQAEQARIDALQSKQQAEIARIDEHAYALVAQGLGIVPGSTPDPDFVQAYDTLSAFAMQTARSYFPEASDEQVAEFVSLSQQLDLRRFAQMRVDPREELKSRYRFLVSAIGGGNGSGNGTPAPASAPESPAPAPPSPIPSPAVARVQAEAARSARTAPLAVPGPNRPAGTPSTAPSPEDFETSEDYVEAVLAGMLGDEDSRIRQHRRER